MSNVTLASESARAEMRCAWGRIVGGVAGGGCLTCYTRAAACDEASWVYSVLIVLHVFLVSSTSRELSELESLGIVVQILLGLLTA